VGTAPVLLVIGGINAATSGGVTVLVDATELSVETMMGVLHLS
jgi:hypothetical protein